MREIKVGQSNVWKFAILTYSESMNFDFYEFLNVLKDEKYQINKIHHPKNGKKEQFRTSEIDFT